MDLDGLGRKGLIGKGGRGRRTDDDCPDYTFGYFLLGSSKYVFLRGNHTEL
jgi:hypothetical protein